MFAKKVESLEDVQSRLRIYETRELPTVRMVNRYLATLASGSANPRYFELSRSVKHGDKKVKGELAGAVMFGHRLPIGRSIAGSPNEAKIPVAVPIHGTHDHRGYVAVEVPASSLDRRLMIDHTTSVNEIAAHVASTGVHGYLRGEIPGIPLQALEQKMPLWDAMRRSR